MDPTRTESTRAAAARQANGKFGYLRRCRRVAWLLHLLDEFGITNMNGRWYAFWSGFGSDVGELALLGTMVAFWRKHTCHVESPRFCWRWGAHPVEGTPYKTCAKHHPEIRAKITHDEIREAHAGRANR